jgi:hypothetical protein
MHARTVTVAALLALTALTGCGSDDKADTAACRAAIEQQALNAMKNGQHLFRPAECDGVDDTTVRGYRAEFAGMHATDDLNDSLDNWEKDVDDYVDGTKTDAP